jgi:hypothetical protein
VEAALISLIDDAITYQAQARVVAAVESGIKQVTEKDRHITSQLDIIRQEFYNTALYQGTERCNSSWLMAYF